MEDELGAQERRYVEAYLELEAHASAAPEGARERALAAMLAEADAVEHEAPPRASRPGAWMVAGLGLCAAAVALAWWVGRASLVEEHAQRVHDQAPLVTHGDRAVHEAASRRGGGTAPPRSTTPGTGTPGAPEAAAAPVPAAPETARVEPDDARAPMHRRGEPEPAPEPARRRPHVEPDEPTPTLSDAEVALLERARRLTQQGEHGAALAVLREHARSYPHSVLGPERTAEQVAVLCRMGAASAESARASFMAGDPPQYLRSRVEKACTP